MGQETLTLDLEDPAFLTQLNEAINYQIKVSLDAANRKLKFTDNDFFQMTDEELGAFFELLKRFETKTDGAIDMKTFKTPIYKGNELIYLLVQVLGNRFNYYYERKKEIGKEKFKEIIHTLLQVIKNRFNVTSEYLYDFEDYIKNIFSRNNAERVEFFKEIGLFRN